MASTVWRGRLTFGMISIPVRLSKAARRERIRFHNVYRPADLREASAPPEVEDEPPPPPAPLRKGNIHALPPPPPAEDRDVPEETVARVRNLPVAAASDVPIERPSVLKGFEIEKDRYVTFEPQEVAALRPRTSTELPIAEFVRLDEIDPIYFETSYYASPDTGGEKPYALLFRALSETGYAAVGSLAMHGREHATVVRPGRRGLILHTLFYQNEVRADEEFSIDPGLVNAKELELARMFVTALAAPFDASKLKDTFEERLRQAIDARAAEAVPAQSSAAPRSAAVPVVDIMEALRKSLEMAKKKPPQSERPESKPRARRSRSGGI